VKPIETLRKVRHAIRTGYAWPGGYRIDVVMTDGAVLCTQCARENYRLISYATRHGIRDGWAASGSDVHWEGSAEHCAHCSKVLPSEYGNPDKGAESC